MEYRERTDKLLVVADESGTIMSAMWPGADSEDGPTETGMGIPEGQSAYEVVVAEEFHELAQTDLGKLRLKTDTPEATLIRDGDYDR